ncbi:hypothetical protein HDV05_000079 [Chytridiales sp. JEL 0842]|nr:hypothetical protein HDV05_000079 [Chytridiales sp. JEL 0842]
MAATRFRTLVNKLSTTPQHTREDALHDLRWMLDKLITKRITEAVRQPGAPNNTDQLLEQLHGNTNDVDRERRLAACLKHLSQSEQERLERWVWERSETSKPLQYILGNQPFAGLDLAVAPPTLIPRWETEEWTMKLVELWKPRLQKLKSERPFRILDLCTGSGCIPLALAHHLSPVANISVHGVDISTRALELARRNAKQTDLGHAVHFHKLDIMQNDQIHEKLLRMCDTKGFDLVVSNPPYIPEDEYKELDKSVKEWEDPRALLAPDKLGVAFYERIIEIFKKYPALLNRDRWKDDTQVPRCAVEIGVKKQIEPVRTIMTSEFKDVEVWSDLAEKPRCIVGYGPR